MYIIISKPTEQHYPEKEKKGVARKKKGERRKKIKKRRMAKHHPLHNHTINLLPRTPLLPILTPSQPRPRRRSRRRPRTRIPVPIPIHTPRMHPRRRRKRHPPRSRPLHRLPPGRQPRQQIPPCIRPRRLRRRHAHTIRRRGRPPRDPDVWRRAAAPSARIDDGRGP